MTDPAQIARGLIPFPDAFPNKGKYKVYSSSWDFIGYADKPQYSGQMPITFPEDATPLECFFGGYLAARDAVAQIRGARVT